MEKIGFALIGAGLWGHAHANVYATHPYARLVAVCDVVEEKAKDLARQYGVPWYVDYREMLKDHEIKAVGIATPDFAHCDPLVECVKAGKAVLVEKPLATTREDVDRIMEAITRYSGRVMVDFHARWSPPIAVAKECIERGELGRIISAYYRLNDTISVPMSMLSWAAKSSILWFLGSHTVDTLRFLLSDEVKRVYSVSRSEVLVKKGIDVPDIFQTTLEFKSGIIAQIENNWIVPNTNPNVNDTKLNVLGSKGMINMDLTHNQAFERYLEDRADHPDILVKPLVHGKYTGFAYESIRDFVERVATGRDFLVTAEDGAKVTSVILSIMESAKKREPVDVVY
ncbi:MAG TPA: Gfo/Idh/MocA family oxidoreductase [Firmicutes bacterium]|nr:Gfo/Idh/MocA family oxidoreductase [Bacillota bacterium]